MIHTRIEKQKYQCLNNSTLIDIILDKEDKIKELDNIINNPEDMTLMYMWCDEKAKDKIKSLESKLRHIEQYFDDLDDIDYKTIKYEVEKILKEN